MARCGSSYPLTEAVMQSKTITVRVPATFEGSRDAPSAVREFLIRLSAPPQHAARFELALAESVNNVAEHGHCGEDDMVDVSIGTDGETLRIVVSDDALAADSNGLNRVMSGVETRDAMSGGGHGMRLIRSIMNEAVYSRERNRNVLTMTARLDGARA
jgi:anti-sigma regulatory factor (Ser/Thr protein kinase)